MARRQKNKQGRGKKNRKHGRNADKCKLYRLAGRRERNKERKLRRHLDSHPADAQARQALDMLL